MQLLVKVIPLKQGTSESAGAAEMVPCPADVEAETLLSFLTQVYGELIDIAWTSTERHARLETGWIFPGERVYAPDVELLCVPFILYDDSRCESLFEVLADERLRMEELAASGAFDEYRVVT